MTSTTHRVLCLQTAGLSSVTLSSDELSLLDCVVEVASDGDLELELRLHHNQGEETDHTQPQNHLLQQVRMHTGEEAGYPPGQATPVYLVIVRSRGSLVDLHTTAQLQTRFGISLGD